jgi:hypothetical protein
MRAKGTCGKGIVGASSANFVQKNNSHKNRRSSKKNYSNNDFQEEEEGSMLCVREPDHFDARCSNRKGGRKFANMVISEAGGTSEYGNLLPTVLCQ